MYDNSMLSDADQKISQARHLVEHSFSFQRQPCSIQLSTNTWNHGCSQSDYILAYHFTNESDCQYKIILSEMLSWPFTGEREFGVKQPKPHAFRLNARTLVRAEEEICICRSKLAAFPCSSSWPFAGEGAFSVSPSKPHACTLIAQTLVCEGEEICLSSLAASQSLAASLTSELGLHVVQLRWQCTKVEVIIAEAVSCGVGRHF